MPTKKVFGRKIRKNKGELPWLGINVIKCIIWHVWFNNNKWLVKGFFLSFLLLQRWSRKWWNFYQYDLISILSKDISTLDNISTLISTDSTSTSTFSIARSAESHRLYLCPWHQNIKKWNAKAEKLLPLVTSHRFSNYERIIKQDFLYPLVRWANTDTTDEKVTQLVLSSLSSFHNKNYACLSKFCILPPITSRAVYKVFFSNLVPDSFCVPLFMHVTSRDSPWLEGLLPGTQ